MTETLADEHLRLLRETDALRREHDQLEREAIDILAHREHCARLRSQLEKLSAHHRRLRKEALREP